MVVQRERMQGGKAGEDSHRKFNAGWKTGRPWLDFRKVTTTDHDSAGNSVLFSVKYKDDPNWWTHSLLREGYGKDKHWVLLGLPSRDFA